MNSQNTLKILLVDEDYQIRLAFADFLSDDGHLVTTCENPVQAIELLKKENDFNLIISDFNMPLMTGGDFNQWLIGSSLNIPFILMSGNIEQITEAKRSKLSLLALLEKPNAIYQVKALIDQLVEGAYKACV